MFAFSLLRGFVWGEVPIKLQPHRLQGRYEKHLCTNVIQLAVLASHQNGRDTHLRQVKVFGPRIDVTRSADQPFSFANPEFFGFSQVR